jgi:hypothetical protein
MRGRDVWRDFSLAGEREKRAVKEGQDQLGEKVEDEVIRCGRSRGGEEGFEGRDLIHVDVISASASVPVWVLTRTSITDSCL